MPSQPNVRVPGPPQRGKGDREEFEAAFKFFRQWLREPRSIAALAPSGRELARRVAAAVGRDARAVVELGGGTGVVTRALLERGLPPERLLVLERNPALHRHLVERFPGVEVALADAFDLVEVVRRSRGIEIGRVDAVASGLGLLNMAREDQRRLLVAALEVLRPAGRFVQFTYAPVSPLARELREELGLEARRASWSLLNLPPAFVYVLRRRRRGR
jgi:phospholipid N-methyltransferase